MRRGGFTLIEIILSIVLIGAAGGMVAFVAGLNADSFKSRPPDRVLVSAVKAARAAAIERGRKTSLAFHPRGYFVVSDFDTAETLERIFISRSLMEHVEKSEKKGEEPDWESFPCKVRVSFKGRFPEIVNAVSVIFDDDAALKGLVFSPDSTMTPARAIVEEEGFDKIVLDFDPFCAAPEGKRDER